MRPILARNRQPAVTLRGRKRKHLDLLVEELEDHDDVQSVSSNFDISEAEIASFSQGG
jgi:transcriptional/translational regulatory protein YebC/TACO1